MNSGKHPWLAGGLVGALILLLPVTGAWGVTPLSNLILRPQDGFTELLVPGAGRLLCDHSSQEPADNHPFRVVLDFCDADHALGQRVFDALPATVISRIRTSQYAETPQKIVRVVLDLRKSATYTVSTEQNDLTVRVVDPDHAAFALWEANPGSRATLASKSETVTTPKSSAIPAAPARTQGALTPETKTTSPNQALATTTAATKTANQPAAGPNIVAAKDVPSTPAPGTAAKSADVTPRVATSNVKSSPAVAATSKSGSQSLAPFGIPMEQGDNPAAKSAKPVTTNKSATTVAAASESTPGEVKKTTPSTTALPLVAESKQSNPVQQSAPATATIALQEIAKTETAPVASVVPASDLITTSIPKQTPLNDGYVVPKRPLVLAPEYLTGDDELAQEPDADPDKVPVSQVSMEPLGPKAPADDQGAASTASVVSPTSAMMASTTTLPIMNRPANPRKPGDTVSVAGSATQGQETLFERLRAKFLTEQTPPRPYTTIDFPSAGVIGGDSLVASTYGPPTPATMLSREELLLRVRQAAEAAGLPPGQLSDQQGLVSASILPARDMVIYDDMGRRDPFAPLVKGLHSGFVSNQIPSVENLRLVGVLRDDHEALALLENQEGYGYVLHVGDQVENGTVTAIQENRVLFQIQDFGWSHIVALQLTTRGSDPSKSLGAKTPVQLEYPDANQMQQPSTNTTQTPKPEGANP
jgi:hypothetical protein